jgi:hypothetical protein
LVADLCATLVDRRALPALPSALRVVATDGAPNFLAALGIEPHVARVLLDPAGTTIGRWDELAGHHGVVRALPGLCRMGVFEARDVAVGDALASEPVRIARIVAIHASVEEGGYDAILGISLDASASEARDAVDARRAMLGPVAGPSAELETKRRAALAAVEEAGWILGDEALAEMYRRARGGPRILRDGSPGATK